MTQFLDDLFDRMLGLYQEGFSWGFICGKCLVTEKKTEHLLRHDARFIALKRMCILRHRNINAYINKFDKKWGINETNRMLFNEKHFDKLRQTQFIGGKYGSKVSPFPVNNSVSTPTTGGKDSETGNKNYWSTIRDGTPNLAVGRLPVGK